MEVPEEMELIVDAAADRIKLAVREATYLKTFMVSGFDITTCGTVFYSKFCAKELLKNGFHSRISFTNNLGSVNSTYGGWVGIPINYLYDSTRDIDRMNIKLRTETIDWNSKYGEMLEQSLVLTDDEKLFGIARSVLELRNYNHIHSTLVPGGTIIGLYVSAQTLNNKYNLFKLPKYVSFKWKLFFFSHHGNLISQ